MRPETARFRDELALALGWSREPMTLRALAAATGATVARVRYHTGCMARDGLVALSRDEHGRVLVAEPTAGELVDWLLAA